MLISAGRITGTLTGTVPQAQSRAAGIARKRARDVPEGRFMAWCPAAGEEKVRIESLTPRRNCGQLGRPGAGKALLEGGRRGSPTWWPLAVRGASLGERSRPP